ncbi:hypothetical protein P153DRAFT_178404 [Dothidotthia symphoricarpi CBS 119687]|uniref:Mid2 domain-containing protein n=1 Tax=Dothidotthia symphoricarpi CBS 119687 TaxID=1392245 RepID=A0A6A6AML8_9PLEO|nr:uncharacterized protein P153DRAFT_178404 [Dothidotthia symphoricarpi CBS 119687]KAF2133030.1 hypothetical protein P153DRAFT_178404 [Dothidotthia symphoricarpi CBS 119687]
MRAEIRSTDCPNGGVFYSCSNGFRGCCLEDPCMPNGGCPKEKDRTPNNSLSANPVLSVPSTRSFSRPDSMSSSSASGSRTKDAVTTSAPPLETIASLSAGQTVFVTITHDPLETSKSSTVTPEPDTRAQHGHSIPIAAIVGPVVGVVVLIATALLIFFCLRRRKRTKMRRAATFPSPYVGSDMSKQLHNSVLPQQEEEERKPQHKTIFSTSQPQPQQLDSREVVPAAELGESPIRHIAELPANSITPIHL